MVIYLLAFAISTILIAIAEKQKTKYFILLSFVAVLIPCLLAGFRAADVGTDVTVYLKQLTHAAISSEDISQYFKSYWFYSWRNMYIKDYDIGFSLLVYFVAKLTSSMVAVQFAVSAVILVPIYIALAKGRKNHPVWLGMLVFYLYFYNTTLNMMRQWAAMAFLLLAFRYLVEKKWGLVALFSAIAMLFHSSALIVVIIYLIYGCLCVARRWRFAQNDIHLSGEMVLMLLITAVTFVAILNLDLVIKLMAAVGVGRFSNYLEGGQLQLLVGQIVLRLPVLLLLVINWKDFRKASPQATFYLGMMLLDMVLSQLISVDVYAFRIGYYFSIYFVLAAPAMYAAIPSRTRRTVTTVALVVYCLFYWYYNYVLQLRHETYPYIFAF